MFDTPVTIIDLTNFHNRREEELNHYHNKYCINETKNNLEKYLTLGKNKKRSLIYYTTGDPIRYFNIILYNTVNKYCTVCDAEKPIKNFTNKTHKRLIEMSNFQNYMFTACNDCCSFIKKEIWNIYYYKFHNSLIKSVWAKIFGCYYETNNISKNAIYDVIGKVRMQNHLRNHFLLKYKFGENVVSIIEKFIGVPKVYAYVF